MSTSPPRVKLPSRFGVVLVSGALALSACTSTGAANTTTETTRVIVTPPSTSATSSTSDPGPTTSTTTLDDVEAAVRQVHTRFMTEMFRRDEREVGPEAFLVLAEELTTGALLARAKESAAGRVSSGERTVSPGFDSNIVRVELGDKTATVLDCSSDRSEVYSADGELIEESQIGYIFRETWLVRDGDTWLVEELLAGGDIPCVPPGS